MKENIPKVEDIELKFYDGYALEDSCRRLQDSINMREKMHVELLNPPASIPISLDLSEGNTEKEKLLKLTKRFANVWGEIELTKTELQSLNREKQILKGKWKFIEQQDADIKAVRRITNNMSKVVQHSRDELNWLRQRVRLLESTADSKQKYLDELNNQIIELRQQSIQIITYDSGKYNEDEIYRLRQILDVLNKRIEELRIIVSKEDEHSVVGTRILKDKDEFVKELRAQLNSLPINETITESSSTKVSRAKRNKNLDRGHKHLKSANSESRFHDRPNYSLTAVRKKIK